MINLENLSLSDISKSRSDLRNLGHGATSMEEVATRVVRYFYANFFTSDKNKRAFVLARFYKTHAYSELPGDLQNFAAKLIKSNLPSPDMKCLTLLATAGE